MENSISSKPHQVNQNRRADFVAKTTNRVKSAETVDRLFPIYNLSWGVNIFCTLVALTISFFHLYMAFSHISGDWRVAIVIAGSIVSLLGVYLTFGIHYNMEIIFFGWIRNYMLVGSLYTMLSLGVLTWCVYLDVRGMSVITTLLSQNNSETEISKKYDAQIADLNEQKKAALDTKWRGSTTRSGMKLATSIDDQIKTKENEKTYEVSKAGGFASQYGGFTMVIAGLFQLLILASSCFINWFKKQVSDDEQLVKSNAHHPTDHKDTHQVKIIPATETTGAGPGPSHRIGFISYPQASDATAPPPPPPPLKDTVATGSYSPANEERIKILLKAWKREKADWSAWRSKRENGRGKEETNLAHMDECLRTMNAIETDLIALGYNTSQLITVDEQA